MKNILFYKYVPLENLEIFRIDQLALCRRLELKGKILIATEGINGNLTGEDAALEEYKRVLLSCPEFKDISFKEGSTSNHNFKKLFVRIKREIVTWKLDVDLNNKASYIEPQELKNMFDTREDFVVLDIRNNYEYDIGHFKNAVGLGIDKSTELPMIMNNLEQYKHKKIVTYCTGGIRCEKASAYLQANGFSNVRQLHGGILFYGEVIGSDHWKGKCFVFDTRGAIDLDREKQAEPITQCTLCRLPTDTYYNCAYTPCDKRFIACEKCANTLHYCCSKGCRSETQIHPERYCNSNT